MTDKIYIIGAGAVGKALAVVLKANGKNVIIIRGSVDDGSDQIKKIRVRLNNDVVLAETIRFSTLSTFKELNGIVVFTNKSYGNDHLAKKLKGKTHHAPIVLLQNGLGIEQTFLANGFTDIYRCVLFMTSQNISENEIRYKPVAVSPIGTIKNTTTNLKTVVAALNSPNFRFKAEKHIQKISWEKVIANCVFNSICPLLDTDNGVFHRNQAIFSIAQRVIKECVAVSEKVGIDLDVATVEKKVLMISKRSDGQFISTLQDIRNHRQTEIDTLNFEIVRIATELNIESLCTETKLLGELTIAKSALCQ